MSDVKDYTDYFAHLAASNKHINHKTERPGFFKFDWQKFVAEKRKATTVLFMHPYQGRLDGSEDNHLDVARVQWSVLQQMDSNKPDEIERVSNATKEIALEIIARMKWHKYEDSTGKYCGILQFLNIEEIEYRVDDIYEDEWTGFRVITPLATNIDLEMDPTKWQ